MGSDVAHSEPRAGAAQAFRVLRVVKGQYAFGNLGDLAIQVWHGQADEASAVALGELAEDMLERYPNGISGIHVLRGGSELPTAGARKRFGELLRDKGQSLGEIAMVLEGSGFWAGAVRSMLTGLRLASGGRAGFRVAASVDEVMAWLPEAHRRRTGTVLDPAKVAEAIEGLQRAGADA